MNDFFNLMKTNFRFSLIRYKYIFKDEHFRFFAFMFLFCSLVVFLLINFKVQPIIFARFFLGLALSSFVMIVIRDIYIMWFVSLEKITGKKMKDEVSFRGFFEMIMEMPETWLGSKLIRLKDLASGVSKSSDKIWGKWVSKIDFWYLGWFCLAFFMLVW